MAGIEESTHQSVDDDGSVSTIQSNKRFDWNKRSSSDQRSATKEYALVIVGLTMLVLVVVVVLVRSSTLQTTPIQWSSCGHDPETARRRKCSFDLISFAWQTPQCYDRELLEEFISWSSWKFFADPARIKPVSLEEALKGEQDLYTDYEYHAVHCTFTYRQMQRAYEEGHIDTHLRSLEHTLHCQRMLLMNGTEAAWHFTIAPVIYPTCSSV
jgi:hypothetical protein